MVCKVYYWELFHAEEETRLKCDVIISFVKVLISLETGPFCTSDP